MIHFQNLQVVLEARAVVAVLDTLQKLDYQERRQIEFEKAKGLYNRAVLVFSQLHPIEGLELL